MPTPGRSFGARWAAALGIRSAEAVAAHRERYARLQDALVFKIDAAGAADPLTAAMAEQQRRDAAVEAEAGAARVVAAGQPATAAGSPHAADADADADADASGWAQYFTDESLLDEINTDLDRLYPTGNEGFFQRADYLRVLRHVLFVWCKLHPDVSYRQGMHDVAAIVMYAFLTSVSRSPVDAVGASAVPDSSAPSRSPSSSASASASAPLPDGIEADTFVVFEVVMLFLKPFYEVAKAPPLHGEEDGPRLFGSCSPSERADDPADLFGAGVSSLFPASATSSSSVSNADAQGGQRASSNSQQHQQQQQQQQQNKPAGRRATTPPKPALHRLCQHVQFELLQQKDPQLYYHLKNLDIVPETYCLRWVRLLFAREFSLDDVLVVWDSMIVDDRRDPVVFPSISALGVKDASSPLESNPSRKWTGLLPRVQRSSDDARWHGFPLLRYLCVAKLLELAPTLRQSDNTGCLRLLMHSGSGGILPSDEDADPSDDAVAARRVREEARTFKTMELIKSARLLRDPMLEEREHVGTVGSINDEHEPEDDPTTAVATRSTSGDNGSDDLGGVEVVEFQSSALGIVLTAARAPYEGRLAVKSFAEDPSSADGVGAAQRSGKVKVGDVLQSINGVPIVGMATEEVKRHIQMVGRPVVISFRHCANALPKASRRSTNFVLYRT